MDRPRRGPAAENLAEAMALLRDVLGRGPATRETVLRHAHAVGITLRTLERAKSELGVLSDAQRDGDHNIWYWSLPDETDSDRIMRELGLA